MAAATDAKPPFDGDLTTDSGFLSQNPLTTTQLDVTVEGPKEEEDSSVKTPANTAGDVVGTENGDTGIEELKSFNGTNTSQLQGESLQTEPTGTDDQDTTQQEDSGLVEMASRASSDTISQTGSEPKEDVALQQEGGLGKSEGQGSPPEDVGAARGPKLSSSPWDTRTSPLSFDRQSPVTPWPLETMSVYVDKMSEYEGEGRRRMLEERWLQLFQEMELRHQEHMLAQQEAHQRQIRHIQVQIEREMLHHQLRQDRRSDSGGKYSSGIGSSRGSPAKEEQAPFKPIAENQARLSGSATDIADSLENYSRQTSKIQDSPESIGYNKKSVPMMQVTDATDEDDDFPSVSTANTPKARERESNGLHGQSEVIAAQWPLREPLKDPQLTKPLTTWSKRQQSVQQKSRDDPKPLTDSIKTRNEEEVEAVNNFYPSTPSSRYPAHDAQILKIGENGSITEEFVPAGPIESVSPSTTVCSGFSYWKMDENDLYQKLPDDLTLNEVSVELSPPRGVVPSQPPPEGRVLVQTHSQGTEVQDQRQPPSQGQLPPEAMKVAQMTPGTKLKTELRDRHERMKATMGDVDMTSDPAGTAKDPSLLEDPVVASNIRVNLREKHARHMADLRAYYEEEITELRSQLERANNPSPYKRLEDGNRRLRDRCEHLEETLQSANGRIQDLEDTVQSMESKQRSLPSPQNSIPVENMISKNEQLRQKVAELEKALADANRHVGELESTLSSLEKSQTQLQSLNSVTSSPMYAELLQANNRLKTRCQQAEEQAQQSHVRIHNLESQLHSLQGKLTEWSDHYENTTRTVEVLQDNLEQTRRQSSMDADTVLKLETRNRQLEREMQETLKADAMRASAIEIEQNLMKKVVEEYGALGREHQSTKAALKEAEDKLFDARSEVVEMKRAIGKLEVQLKQMEHENNLMREKGLSPTITLAEIQQTLSHSGGRFSSPTARRRWLAPSTQHNVFTGEPLDRSPSYIHTAPPGTSQEAEAERPLSPMIQAAIELDRRKHDTAPQKSPKRYGSDETSSETVDSEDERRTYREPIARYSPKRARPGTPKKNQQTQTPPKTGQTRVTDRFTGKNRSPKKSLSPKFHSMDKENEREARSDVEVPTRDNGASLRRNLHFTPPATQGMSVDPRVSSAVEAVKSGSVTSRPQWEDKRTTLAADKKTPKRPSPVRPPYDTEDAMRERMAKVRDVERRFDSLNEEKRQLESSLSRIPSSGPRLTRQLKLDQEALEDRLDKVVKELGSVRMTLRRYNVLRS
ncbi:M-phase phosphoprotein 9-like isoform X2 [Branchiostoma lanceolatum]|uniref:M-phase phosphoprotein 9-like isoform X2 n=1 Tax=Branchiostoma lanceolatum TaxID=7740 RepID=UPI0034533205